MEGLSKSARKRQEKQRFAEVNKIVEIKMEIVKRLSPVYEYLKGDMKREELLKMSNKEDSMKEVRNLIYNNPSKYNKLLTEALEAIIRHESCLDGGLPTEVDIDDEIDKVTRFFGCLSIEEQYKLLRSISENDLLSRLTLTKLKQKVYSESDSLYTEVGTELTKLCFTDVKLETIATIIDEMIESDKECVEPNLRQHFIKAERARLKELMVIGDPFYIWRGFLVDETDYVRLGKKEEGPAYWKQNAGKGVSYSLDRNVAGYFCYYKYAYKNGKSIVTGDSYYLSKYIPPVVMTREENITENTKIISDLRNTDKRKPIVGKFLVCPNDIKGFNMDKTEAEVNFTTDNIVVQDYKILKSKEIAECMYESKQKGTTDIIDFAKAFNKEGIVAFSYEDKGKAKVLFAEGQKVNDKLDEMKRKAIKNKGLSKASWNEFLLKLYKKNEVPEPSGFNPLKLTKDLYDLLTRRNDKG